MRVISEKFKEVGLAVLPFCAITVFLYFLTGGNMAHGKILVNFLLGTAMLIIGEVLFLVGVDNSIMSIGSFVGGGVTKFKHITLALFFGFVFGFSCTAAEPDVQILGQQITALSPSIKSIVVVAVISLGVGIYIAISVVRTLTGFKLKWILLGSYVIIGALAVAVWFKNPQFLAVSFDSGGATTGTVTVPFVLSFGIAIASVRGKDNSGESNFGTLAMGSIGPVMAMLIFGLIIKIDPSNIPNQNLYEVLSFGEVMLGTLGDVASSVLPILVIFLVFQFFTVRLPLKKLLKIILALLVVFIGLALFLGGINFGFSAAAFTLGKSTGSSGFWWILIPVALIAGVATVYTEPAIAVLGGQVSEVSDGQISKKLLVNTLAVAIAIAVLLAVLRVLFKINIWWIIGPLYVTAVGMAFISPEIFSSLAWDSGGVASGTITTAYSLPLVVGISQSAAGSGDPMLYAYGVVALVAIMPVVAIQFIGIAYKRRATLSEKRTTEEIRARLASDRCFAGLE